MSKLPVSFLVFILFSLPKHSIGASKNESTSAEPEGEVNIFKEWFILDENLKALANSTLQHVLPSVKGILKNTNLTSQCRKDGDELVAGINDLKGWALQLIDSSGKIIDGFLHGTLVSLGNYEECLGLTATKSINEVQKEVLFKGQYCTIRALLKLPSKRNILNIKNGMLQLKNFSRSTSELTKLLYSKAEAFRKHSGTLNYGICFPSGCTLDDVNQIARQVGKKLSMHAAVVNCDTKKESRINTSNAIAITFYSLAVLLVLIGSLLELYCNRCEIHLKNKGLRALLAFSVIQNFKRLVNTELSKECLPFLHGFRFLSMTWIVFSHTTLMSLMSIKITANLSVLAHLVSKIWVQVITNGFLAVDSFFFLGGFLNAYIRVREQDNGKVPKGLVFTAVHRLWRIYPLYLYSILFPLLLQNVTSGPNYHDSFQPRVVNCQNNWWQNIIFLNNFLLEYDKMCVTQSWYLATDFQLFLVALFSISIFLKWPKIGLMANGFLVLASIIYMGFWTQIHNLPPTFLFHGIDTDKIKAYFLIYSKPFMHAGPYFVGVLTGFFLSRNKDIKISKFVLFLGWALSICVACACIFATKRWNSGTKPTALETVFYSSLSRVAYAASLSWLFTCCTTGHGGIVNSILSSKMWTILSRLTYATFLLSPFVQTLFMSNQKLALDTNPLNNAWRFAGDLCYSLVVALCITLLVEAPFMSLEKIVFPGKTSKLEDDNKLSNSTYRNAAYEIEVNGKTDSPLKYKL